VLHTAQDLDGFLRGVHRHRMPHQRWGGHPERGPPLRGRSARPGPGGGAADRAHHPVPGHLQPARRRWCSGWPEPCTRRRTWSR
jgi:hypothetical protein